MGIKEFPEANMTFLKDTEAAAEAERKTGLKSEHKQLSKKMKMDG